MISEIYEWCKKRFDYYEHRVDKSIHELYDDARIMLSKSDRVRGDYDFFAIFMFWQCKRHEKPAFLVRLADMDALFCADRTTIYHPVMGPLPAEDFTVTRYSSTGESWKSF